MEERIKQAVAEGLRGRAQENKKVRGPSSRGLDL
jgi:hypothetical protein